MHLFFDLDGVLIDLKELHRDAFITSWNHICSQSPIDIPFHTKHLEARPTKDKVGLCNQILHTQVPIKEVSELKQTLTEQLIGDFKGLSTVTETIKWLKAQGHILACCSNSIRRTIHLALSKLDILDQFDLILSNEDVVSSKPHPEIYLKAAKHFGINPQDCLVFEDSPVGKKAATDAFCTVIPVTNSSDITIEFVKGCIQTRSRIPLSPPQAIHLVIPMGGLGSRFEKEGYTTPKPFLPIFGKEMYKWVIENMLPKDPILRRLIQTHIIIREEHRALFQNHLEGIHLHTIPALTEGPACTVLAIKDIINTSDPLVIANSDQHLEWDSDALYYSLLHPSIDGIISTFSQLDPADTKWSYAKTDTNQNVIEVAEKRYISSNASTGIYGWRHGSDFVAFAESMIQQNIRVNNEFYVCPVYNEAIRAHKSIRVLECYKMWGLGVPKDYEIFLANWKNDQEPIDLEQLYTNIDRRNSRPKAQIDALRSDLYTRALWTMGDWKIQMPQLFQDLQDLSGQGIVFDLSGFNGQLHWTLLQFQTFPVRPDQTTYNDDELIQKCQQILDESPPIHITFRGISRTRFGLFLCGYPNYNVNEVRDRLRVACSGEMIEPHPQDMYHATLFRFTQDPSQAALNLLDQLVNKYRGALIASMRPAKWEFGYGTWTQRAADRQIKASWPAKPPLWILHRGLKAGPDLSLENKEALLKQRIGEGWNVEADLWLHEGGFWLGHDTPETLLQDIGLLACPKAWIHCKNLEMLTYMTEKKPGAPFFSHDQDQAVLTSDGHIWCYPGFQAGSQSIVVMPERVPGMAIDYSTIAGVCSDFTFIATPSI